jgi:hypothetical protein
MKVWVHSLWVVLFVPACQQLGTSPEPDGLLVQTGGSTFTRDPALGSATVPFSVVNRGRSTLYLTRCGERLMAALERWENGQWVQYSGDACQTIYPMDPHPLAPSASVSSVHRILEPGRYRLRPGVQTSASEPTIWTAAISNQFRVEVGR